MENFDRIVTDPRLNRAMVEAHVGSSRAGLLLLGEYRVMATGGTTGVRGVFVYDQDAWEIAVANLRRLQRLLDVPAGLKYVGIGAPSPVHLSNRFYAEGRVGHRDAPSLSVTTPMPEVVAALNAFQPDIISSYPSFLRRLTEEQRSGRLRISPGTVRSTAEALLPDVRARVLATWNVPVTNNYGSTEFGIIGMECKHRCGLHLVEDLLIMEIVDAENRPVPAGTQGAKVLVTPLFNKTLPLIRYELTDLLTVLPGDCACGSPFRRIDDIEGRSEEILDVWTASGQQVKVHAARLWFHLVRIPGIEQYQFVQLPKGIKVLIAANAGADAHAVRRAVEQIAGAALDDLGATGGQIEVEIVAKIDRVGTAAKERRVVAPAAVASATPASIGGS
jgi:phenylacetate-coenzyme A ligase PaaK-like adenylate-forming protein